MHIIGSPELYDPTDALPTHVYLKQISVFTREELGFKLLW